MECYSLQASCNRVSEGIQYVKLPVATRGDFGFEVEDPAGI